MKNSPLSAAGRRAPLASTIEAQSDGFLGNRCGQTFSANFSPNGLS